MHKNYQSLAKNAANYVPLSPLSFIKRTASIFSEQPSIVYNERSWTWAQTYQRVIKLASALTQHGIKLGDTVSVMLPNLPEMVEAHFGVPMSGAVLNAINYRLDNDTIGYILSHSDCRLLIVDTQFADNAKAVIDAHKLTIDIVRVEDSAADVKGSAGIEYERFIDTGDEAFDWQLPSDEWQALTLNYTSGTSGRPKGVVYHHRGSYLMSMGTVAGWQLPMHPNYLYIVPLFHCNGWGHAWTMALAAGTIVCCRNISAKVIFDAVADHKISHFGGAPVVLGLLINSKAEDRRVFNHHVSVMTAGAPPPPTVLSQSQKLGFEVMQVYGLTETYGHVTQCIWQQKWDDLNEDEQAQIKSWQGVSFPINEDLVLIEPDSGELVAFEQGRRGEIAMRGNTVMKGYYKDQKETKKAFAGGYFHSGDVACWREDGYVQIQDRIKDVIISGGENISSVEVEGTLYKHPAVANAAVVAKADEKWGEVPCGFVELKENMTLNEEELIAFCREHLAGFKVPKQIIFCDLPKTATGKIQKFLLREKI